MAKQTDWWKALSIYQVYPKSFQDSNHDGIGDVKGITSRLDYIRDLGVNMIWLNPIFMSPQIDNGYDVADYYEIDPHFGTMADVEELIEKAHVNGIKVTFDLVMNHTSDQHPWFQEAIKGKNNPYRNFYIFEDSRINKAGKEIPPSNWEGFFTGSVWDKEPNGDQYYFHLFAKEMPDLNWKNPKVMDEMVRMTKFWAEKGIDGFRIDAFIHILKEEGFPNLEGLEEGKITLAENYYANLDGVNELMAEFTGRVKADYPEIFFLGEAASADIDSASLYSDPITGAMDQVISFRYFTEDNSKKDSRLSGNMQAASLDIPTFKTNMVLWQEAMANRGGPVLYWNNHDMARAVSRFGDDSRWRENSAKMLATMMYLQKGIPCILNGEELGMKNLELADISSYNSPEAQTFYKEAKALDYSEEWIMTNLQATTKDASRGAMQWTFDKYMGFSDVEPWAGVNVERYYNAEDEEQDPYSILQYYRDVLAIKNLNLFREGEFRLWDTSDDFYVYDRVLKGEKALVICNLTNKAQEFYIPPTLQNGHRHLVLQNEGNNIKDCQLLLASYGCAVYLYTYSEHLSQDYPYHIYN